MIFCGAQVASSISVPLFAEESEHGVQYKQGQVWLLYQKYADMGYVKSKTYTVSDEKGDPNAKLHTCWTQKGRLFIYELLKEHGILPLIERVGGTK